MHTLLIIIHVLACVALILIVLLQTGRGAEMGAAFGGASQTLFGGSGGTTFMSKLTTGAAIIFMLTCLSLSYLATGVKSKSIMENVSQPAKEQGPVLPAPKPVQPVPSDQGASIPSTQPEQSSSSEPTEKGNAATSAKEPSMPSQPSQPSNPSQKP